MGNAKWGWGCGDHAGMKGHRSGKQVYIRYTVCAQWPTAHTHREAVSPRGVGAWLPLQHPTRRAPARTRTRTHGSYPARPAPPPPPHLVVPPPPRRHQQVADHAQLPERLQLASSRRVSRHGRRRRGGGGRRRAGRQPYTREALGGGAAAARDALQPIRRGRRACARHKAKCRVGAEREPWRGNTDKARIVLTRRGSARSAQLPTL